MLSSVCQRLDWSSHGIEPKDSSTCFLCSDLCVGRLRIRASIFWRCSISLFEFETSVSTARRRHRCEVTQIAYDLHAPLCRIWKSVVCCALQPPAVQACLDQIAERTCAMASISETFRETVGSTLCLRAELRTFEANQSDRWRKRLSDAC